MAYEKEKQTAIDLALKAGKEIARIYYTGFEKEDKADGSPVTEADKMANRIIVEGIKKSFPLDSIISEEDAAVNMGGARTWHVDPLDGTRSFVKHSDTFAVHIGLALNGTPELGIVYKPISGECYVGVVGEGAYVIHPHGKRELKVSGKLDGMVVSMSTKIKNYESAKPFLDEVGMTNHISVGSEGLRIMNVAENRAHFRVGDIACHSWDLCAPDAVLRAAGGAAGYLNSLDKPLYLKAEMPDRVIFARNELLLYDTRLAYQLSKKR